MTADLAKKLMGLTMIAIGGYILFKWPALLLAGGLALIILP